MIIVMMIYGFLECNTSKFQNSNKLFKYLQAHRLFSVLCANFGHFARYGLVECSEDADLWKTRCKY